jgi:hypothetical protein
MKKKVGAQHIVPLLSDFEAQNLLTRKGNPGHFYSRLLLSEAAMDFNFSTA